MQMQEMDSQHFTKGPILTILFPLELYPWWIVKSKTSLFIQGLRDLIKQATMGLASAFPK